MKSILRVVAALAMVGTASAVYAQTSNGSDVTGHAAGSLPGGAFIPMGAPGVGNARLVINNTGLAFSNGMPTDTSVHVAFAAEKAIGGLISTGSPSLVAEVSGALTAGGAPAGAANTLTQALANLAGTSNDGARAAIVAAVNAYNALVAAAPVSFLRNPPADFLAIQAALTQIVNKLK